MADSTFVKVDPTLCQGVGICAHKAPDIITLDMWGYPILEVANITGKDLKKAQLAVSACPKDALFLQTDKS